jgi:hypothetical protein
LIGNTGDRLSPAVPEIAFAAIFVSFRDVGRELFIIAFSILAAVGCRNRSSYLVAIRNVHFWQAVFGSSITEV